MVRAVIKRDGRENPFNSEKIYVAVMKAFNEREKKDGNAIPEKEDIAKQIAKEISESSKDKMTVEEIQDIVETKLMKSSRPEVAKDYILYRDKRTVVRDRKNKLVQKVMVRAKSQINEHSNANVDEESFSGREKEASADIGKTVALEYGGLSDEVALAHKIMLIYQHDLEKAIYGVHNCLNLFFQYIFKHGFKTRNGDVRPPKSFSTACQLVAVAFQCQSQVCKSASPISDNRQ